MPGCEVMHKSRFIGNRDDSWAYSPHESGANHVGSNITFLIGEEGDALS